MLRGSEGPAGAFREAVQIVYTRLGGHAAFLEWTKDNPTEYYRIAARLIPGEMQEGNGAGTITVHVHARPAAVAVPPAIVDQSRSMEE